MSQWIRLILAVAPVCAFAGAMQVSDLSWMEGSWKAITPGGVYENSFSSTSGDLILGTAKMTMGPKAEIGFFEFDQIKMVDGVLTLFPAPSGTPGVSFKAIESSDKKVVFENADHDFPHRITYSVNDTGQMDLVVEGTQQGQPVRSEFLMNKQ